MSEAEGSERRVCVYVCVYVRVRVCGACTSGACAVCSVADVDVPVDARYVAHVGSPLSWVLLVVLFQYEFIAVTREQYGPA